MLFAMLQFLFRLLSVFSLGSAASRGPGAVVRNRARHVAIRSVSRGMRKWGLCLAFALLAAGVDVDARDDDGFAALYWAASSGHAEVVRLLREAGGR